MLGPPGLPACLRVVPAVVLPLVLRAAEPAPVPWTTEATDATARARAGARVVAKYRAGYNIESTHIGSDDRACRPRFHQHVCVVQEDCEKHFCNVVQEDCFQFRQRSLQFWICIINLGAVSHVSFSASGSQAGIAAANVADAIVDALRVILVKRPCVVLEEQVRGWKFKKHVLVDGQVKRCLKAAGYKGTERILDSLKYGGVPQKRNRFYRISVHMSVVKSRMTWAREIKAVGLDKILYMRVFGIEDQHSLIIRGIFERC